MRTPPPKPPSSVRAWLSCKGRGVQAEREEEGRVRTHCHSCLVWPQTLGMAGPASAGPGALQRGLKTWNSRKEDTEKV